MNPTIHFVWCHPGHCTVTDDRPDTGVHQSNPVPVDIDDQIEPFRATAYLHRPAGLSTTFLVIDAVVTEIMLPVDTAAAGLTVVNRLLGRTVAPEIWPNERAGETATRCGFPASAEDDFCPVDGLEIGTHWLGADDFGHNWWIHESGDEACGHRWSNPIRRPHNGVPIVLVTPVETICFYCGNYRLHTSAAEAAAYGAAHTAKHEAEVPS